MSVPSVTSSLQVPVGQPDSAQVLDALTPATTVSVSSIGPVLPASYLDRDPEQIAASEALLVLHEGPRAFESSLLAETIPETQDIPQTSDVPQPSDVSQDFEVIIPCRTTAADPRPYLRLVDPAAVTLPLHSAPMDEVPDVRDGSLGTQYVTPVFWKLPHTAGQTHPPPSAEASSLHLSFLCKINIVTKCDVPLVAR